ncbi:hypothetical protein GGR56DRAFT_261126 [Xylariaceae sp. FL0804]|nr:hypothetical protein GGR56DRAFT_261126 [Xylariaceae sp. FL0804]
MPPNTLGVVQPPRCCIRLARVGCNYNCCLQQGSSPRELILVARLVCSAAPCRSPAKIRADRRSQTSKRRRLGLRTRGSTPSPESVLHRWYHPDRLPIYVRCWWVRQLIVRYESLTGVGSKRLRFPSFVIFLPLRTARHMARSLLGDVPVVMCEGSGSIGLQLEVADSSYSSQRRRRQWHLLSSSPPVDQRMAGSVATSCSASTTPFMGTYRSSRAKQHPTTRLARVKPRKP